jgi:hypothetical protein
MRTRTVLASAAALLLLAVLTSCASCGGGGGGGGSAEEGSAPGSHVAVTWIGSDDAAGYVVHWGIVSRAYSHDIDVLKPVADAQGTVTVVVALDGDATVSAYYFAITSYDSAHNASGYSNELSIDAPALL